MSVLSVGRLFHTEFRERTPPIGATCVYNRFGHRVVGRPGHFDGVNLVQQDVLANHLVIGC